MRASSRWRHHGRSGDRPCKQPRGLVWDWTSASLGALYALPAGVYSLAAIAAIAGAGATHRSRWYVTSGFSTFLVFPLLLNSRPQDSALRFDERRMETVLGVGLAYVFGLGLPAPTEHWGDLGRRRSRGGGRRARAA